MQISVPSSNNVAKMTGSDFVSDFIFPIGLCLLGCVLLAILVKTIRPKRWKWFLEAQVPFVLDVFSGSVFRNGRVCKSKARLDGKTAIVTGCNTGIGKYTVKDFYQRGCRVIMACRDVKKAEEAKSFLESELKGVESTGEICVKQLDTSSLQSVRRFAEEVLKEESKIDILVNNAGVFMHPLALSEDGFELHFATNHLGHFLLTLLLLPALRAADAARIVNVTSHAHHLCEPFNFEDMNYNNQHYSPFEAYSRSKMANILFTVELAKRLEGSNMRCYAVHPGVVVTDAGRHMSTTLMPGASEIFNRTAWLVLKSPQNGAQTTIHCAVDEAAGRETGLYYNDCRVVKASRRIKDEELLRSLWKWSVKAVGVEDPLPLSQAAAS